MPLRDQQLLFDYFSATLDATIKRAKSEGRYESGMEVISELSTVRLHEKKLIHTDEATSESKRLCFPLCAECCLQLDGVHIYVFATFCCAPGAETHYMKLEVDDGLSWAQALQFKQENVDQLKDDGAEEKRIKKVGGEGRCVHLRCRSIAQMSRRVKPPLLVLSGWLLRDEAVPQLRGDWPPVGALGH